MRILIQRNIFIKYLHFLGIARRKPKSDQLDQANPVRNDETGLWQCPFCLQKDFPELSDVWNHFDAGNCPGQATGVKLRLDNGISGILLLYILQMTIFLKYFIIF